MNEDKFNQYCRTLEQIEQIIKKMHSYGNEDECGYHAFGLLFHAAKIRTGNERLKMTDISKYMHITKPAATYIVKRLTERGLVEKIEDTSDRRIVYIKPTPEGKAVFTQTMSARLDILDRAVSRLGPENEQTFSILFRDFLDALNDEMEAR